MLRAGCGGLGVGGKFLPFYTYPRQSPSNLDTPFLVAYLPLVSIAVAFPVCEFLSGKIMSPIANVDFPISTDSKGDFLKTPYIFEIYIYPSFLLPF